jgi:hypothetical protein
LVRVAKGSMLGQPACLTSWLLRPCISSCAYPWPCDPGLLCRPAVPRNPAPKFSCSF